jgi:hypothetical protein
MLGINQYAADVEALIKVCNERGIATPDDQVRRPPAPTASPLEVLCQFAETSEHVS